MEEDAAVVKPTDFRRANSNSASGLGHQDFGIEKASRGIKGRDKILYSCLPVRAPSHLTYITTSPEKETKLHQNV